MAVLPLSSIVPSAAEGINAPLLHAEGMLYGAEVDVSQVETVLAVEGVPQYGTLAGELQEYPVEVECGHLKEQVGNLLQA